MNNETCTTNQRKQCKSNRDDMPNNLVRQQCEKFPGNKNIELALTILAIPKFIRQLFDCDGTISGHK